jgi:hypothetical protein
MFVVARRPTRQYLQGASKEIFPTWTATTVGWSIREDGADVAGLTCLGWRSPSPESSQTRLLL